MMMRKVEIDLFDLLGCFMDDCGCALNDFKKELVEQKVYGQSDIEEYVVQYYLRGYWDMPEDQEELERQIQGSCEEAFITYEQTHIKLKDIEWRKNLYKKYKPKEYPHETEDDCNQCGNKIIAYSYFKFGCDKCGWMEDLQTEND